jgi:ribosome biogenesis GTPase A
MVLLAAVSRHRQTIVSNMTHKLIVSILGPPNAGKSTLFNRLLDKAANRAYKPGSEKGRKRHSWGKFVF